MKKDRGFVPLREINFVFNSLPDTRLPEEQIRDRLNDYEIWGYGLKLTLRCYKCGKTSRSNFPYKHCPCGHQQIYVTRPMRQAAEALYSAGFDLRGAADLIATTDYSDITMLLVHTDFNRVYEREIFFGMPDYTLPDGWDCLTLTDDTGQDFTRLFNNGKAQPLTINNSAKEEVKRLAAELAQWGRELKDTAAWAVMVLMNKI